MVDRSEWYGHMTSGCNRYLWHGESDTATTMFDCATVPAEAKIRWIDYPGTL